MHGGFLRDFGTPLAFCLWEVSVCVGGIFQNLDIAMRPDRFPAVNTMKRGGEEGRLMSSSNQEPPHQGGEGIREVEYRNKQTGRTLGLRGAKQMGAA